jgi:precorrin-6B C5,15-methyltransferase / cobalt-precorrin-6B C5,C15-methyltransferase
MMPAEPLRQPASGGRWLSIVGIGEDGIAGLGNAAQNMIRSAEIVFGGKRHLALAAELVTGEARAWPSPFEKGIDTIVGLRGRNICVLASGDAFLHGVGATLARRIDASEMNVLPAPSAFSLAAARLGWPLHETTTVSLHGKALDLIRPKLHPCARILALTSDADGPAALARLLCALGFGPSRLTVLEALGGPDERITTQPAFGFSLDAVNPLNLVAIEVDCEPHACVLPLGFGLGDDLFEHDGQITKREVRAVTLSALAPRRGELLWDVGAGSGSVSIEWMLADPSMRAVAIEADPERAARIARNAAAFGVPGLTIVEGMAPAAFAGLDSPDAIFLGGGGSDDGVLDGAIDALKPGGRLVANAVTLEMEALLLAKHSGLGGELIRIAVSRALPVGAMSGWRAAMPVTQWLWVKP